MEFCSKFCLNIEEVLSASRVEIFFEEWGRDFSVQYLQVGHKMLKRVNVFSVTPGERKFHAKKREFAASVYNTRETEDVSATIASKYTV